jgi:hypothetical protein
MHNYIHIWGWYCFKDADTTNRHNVCVILKDKNEKWNIFKSYKQLREDVAKAHNDNAYGCGYSCYIPKSEINLCDGEWEIGLGAASMCDIVLHVMWTNKKISNRR